MAKVILDTETGETTDINGLGNVMPVMQDPRELYGVLYNQAYNAMVQQAFNAWLKCWNDLFK